jgi:predicted metalloprotease
MQWRMGRRSDNIEDQRSVSVGRGVGIAGGGIGMLVLVVLALFFGVDPSALLQGGSPPAVQAPAPGQRPAGSPAEEGKEFVSAILASTEDTWRELFRRAKLEYQDPKLVLFSNAVESACGFAQAAAGPFYCPLDQKVYLDLSFLRDLRERFRAPGDFAQAYVIAHEIGHHVQTLLGISERVLQMRQRASEREANALSVRQELQADCFAGVWARNAHAHRAMLEAGDVDEGLNAAAAIGDDRLQRAGRGVVVPDAFTHGSSAQRVRWFKRGLETGEVRACDTFGVNEP